MLIRILLVREQLNEGLIKLEHWVLEIIFVK